MQISRHQQIIGLLLQRGECAVEELASELNVSDMTIRRDLTALAEAGKVIRTHGGALPAGQVSFEFQFLHRTRDREAAKERIGSRAATLVSSGQSVMLDSGTTTLAVARHLRAKEAVTVITTSLPVAATLQYSPAVEVLLLGGRVRRTNPDLGGALTEANLETLHADVAFIGADAIDLNAGVYNQSVEIGRMLGKMAAAAAEVYVVADSSKLDRRALSRFGNAAKWSGLITDSEILPAHATRLRKAGVNVLICTDSEGE